jgi:hypothetical protein
MISTDVDRLTRMMSYFGKLARNRIASHYAAMKAGLDMESYRVSKDVLACTGAL